MWADLKESLRGTNQDFTEGPIGRAILLLAVPMVLEMVMESVFAVVDIFWVSRLGAEAIAAVGLTESLLTLVYTVAVGLSIGVTAMVARRTGERDPEAALVRLSGSATFQTFIGTASWIGLMRIIAIFGSAALAGYTIAIRVVLFALLPAWGMSNAAATMVGQGLGAGKPDRAEQSVWIAGFINFLVLGAVGIVFMVFTDPIIRAFTQDPDTVRNGVLALRTVSAGFFFYAYGMVLIQRGRRHVDAHLGEPVLLLALGDTSCVVAGHGGRAGPLGGPPLRHARLLDGGGRCGVAVPEGEVEAAGGLKPLYLKA